QWQKGVAFRARTLFGDVAVMRDGKIVYAFQDDRPNKESLTETLVGGAPVLKAGLPAITGVTFFLGNDPGNWQENLPSSDELLLGEVWRGISVSLRAHGGSIE